MADSQYYELNPRMKTFDFFVGFLGMVLVCLGAYFLKPILDRIDSIIFGM